MAKSLVENERSVIRDAARKRLRRQLREAGDDAMWGSFEVGWECVSLEGESRDDLSGVYRRSLRNPIPELSFFL